MVDDDLQTLSVNRRFLEMSAEWLLPTDLAVAEHGKGALVAAMSAVETPPPSSRSSGTSPSTPRRPRTTNSR